MVLKQFGSGLKETFKRLSRMSIIDKEAVDSILRDVQRTLLQSDVDVQIVSELSKKVREKILKADMPKGITLKEYFIKTLYDEIVSLLGADKSEIGLKKQRILLIGLYGSGKTTTASKIARWFKLRGLKPALVACDTHRPAAQTQLKQLGMVLGVSVYADGKSPLDIARNALKKSREEVMIFDSAGRDAIDRRLAKELKQLGNLIKPTETILVLPADIGHVAGAQAEEFNKLIGITGLIITKLDGTAKGGGALAAAKMCGAKVKFIGIGEKAEDFEAYDPKRFVARLLGYGDIEGLLEKAKEAGIGQDKDIAEKMAKGDFTLEEFIEQIGQIKKMGSFSKIMEMIPGMGSIKIPKDMIDVQEGKMEKWRHIILSMTAEERATPDILNHTRIKRIAAGSGVREGEVRDMLKYYRQIKKLMKMAKGGKAFKRGPFAKLAKQFGMG